MPIHLNQHCSVTLHRTLRIPDDGGSYPLPPSLGEFRRYPVERDGFMVPMHRAEALWLGLIGPSWRPHALKVGIGGIDAISGAPFDANQLSDQDYVVIPDQPWLDGINAGDGFIRQFVAVPLGEGLTVEAQLTGREDRGGLALALFEPRPGRFPDEPPHEEVLEMRCLAPAAPPSMGLGAGGRMRQEIYADEYGIGTWQTTPSRVIEIELVDALAFSVLTGIEHPPPPDAATYTRHGLPWFDLLQPTHRDIAAADRLRGIRSIGDLEGRREAGLPIPEHQIRRLLRVRESVG